MDMATIVVLMVVFGAMTIFAAMLYYPGHMLVWTGLALIVMATFAAGGAKTILHEIWAGIAALGGLVSVGLGLAVIQLVDIKALLSDLARSAWNKGD